AAPGRGFRLLQQRLGGLRDQECTVVEAALGGLARLVGMDPSRDEILKALDQVIDPELRRPVTELDMVRDIRIEGGDVAVTIALTVAGCPLRSSFEQQVAEALAPVAGVERVSLDFDVMSPEEKAALTTKLRGGVTERTKGISLDRATRVIAVASGKGGVGKSSLTVNLAAAFSALEQFRSDVHWGELDTLVVDMQPGTGDVSISLGQLLPRAEALIVTTPQPLAQEIAARAALMAQKTNMRLLGVIENMSGEVFGSGGGQELADDLHIPMLGSIPLDSALRESGDAGEPLVTANPDTPAAVAISAVADAIAETRREQGVGFVKSLPVLS